MLEEDFNEDNTSLRDKIIKFLKLDIFFSGVQLQLKFNKKEINKFKDEISSYKKEVNELKEEVKKYRDAIDNMSLVGADIDIRGGGWGVICCKSKNDAPYVKFFEISSDHSIIEIEDLIRQIQPNDRYVTFDSPIQLSRRRSII